MFSSWLAFCFWLSCFVVFYSYFGYGVHMWLLRTLFPWAKKNELQFFVSRELPRANALRDLTDLLLPTGVSGYFLR